jgi:hypothetical protein
MDYFDGTLGSMEEHGLALGRTLFKILQHDKTLFYSCSQTTTQFLLVLIELFKRICIEFAKVFF